MRIAVFGRVQENGQQALKMLLSSNEWKCEEVPRVDSDLPEGAQLLIISSTVNVLRSPALEAGTSGTLNMDWMNAVVGFRAEHPDLPIVIVSGGRIPLPMMQGMLGVRLQGDVKIVEIEDRNVRRGDREGPPERRRVVAG